MGTVINFPDARPAGRAGRLAGAGSGTATIVILPVVRIERAGEGPTGEMTPPSSEAGRRRRRRARRS